MCKSANVGAESTVLNISLRTVDYANPDRPSEGAWIAEIIAQRTRVSCRRQNSKNRKRKNASSSKNTLNQVLRNGPYSRKQKTKPRRKKIMPVFNVYEKTNLRLKK